MAISVSLIIPFVIGPLVVGVFQVSTYLKNVLTGNLALYVLSTKTIKFD